jgi:putative addiction module component (TIGR02574 family)
MNTIPEILLAGRRNMATMMQTLGLDRLNPKERLLLLGELWDSLDEAGNSMPLTEPQRIDLQRRVAAYEANPKAGSSWEEVKARLRGQS